MPDKVKIRELLEKQTRGARTDATAHLTIKMTIDQKSILISVTEGKKPYSIGKELSVWIEKLFKVSINPKTIASKVYRHPDFSSNEENTLTNSNDSENENNKEISKGLTAKGMPTNSKKMERGLVMSFYPQLIYPPSGPVQHPPYFVLFGAGSSFCPSGQGLVVF